MSIIDPSAVEIISNFDKISGKLTLYTEKIYTNKEGKPDGIQILERPVTPIEQEIEDAPNSLEEFIYLLQRRIPISKNKILSNENQLSLLGILENEIRLLWPELKNLVDYPLFNENQNKELRSTIFINIILKCKTLFLEYVNKMHIFKNKDIFSDESNLVRIKMHLASDIRHQLHIPTLRRHIYQNIRQDIHLKIPESRELSSIEKEEEKLQYELHDTNMRTTDKMTKTLVPLREANYFSDKQKDVQEPNESKKVFSTENIVETVDENTTKRISRPHMEVNNKKLSNDLLLMINDVDHEDPIWNQNKAYNENIQKKIDNFTKQNEEKRKRHKFVIRPPLVEQPSTIQKSYNNKVYCVPDIRPTERKSDYNIILSVHEPLWNELADEITPEIVKQLDSNLIRGEEVKDIYKEMMKTVSRDYLDYTDDFLTDDCPSKLSVEHLKASRTLYNEIKKERIINPDLKKLTCSSWKAKSLPRFEWEKPDYTLDNAFIQDLDLKHYVQMSTNELTHDINIIGGTFGDSLAPNQNLPSGISMMNRFNTKRKYILSPEDLERGISRLPKLMQDRVIRQYKDWVHLWKQHYNSEDYLKFLSLQFSDFLAVVFHNYDSDEESTEDEEDVDPIILEAKKRMIERENDRISILENKVQELNNEKYRYEKGLWNPSTILIGGLGKIPTLTHVEKNELLKDKPSLPDPLERTTQMSSYRRGVLRKSRNDTVADISGSQLTNCGGEQLLNTIQNRLEDIWNKLKMPNNLRLDMAIKYSSKMYMKSIDDVFIKWDSATRILLDREKLLLELEKFERVASNPNRYFAKGFQGSSIARLEESKFRQDLNEKIDQLSIKVKKAMNDLKNAYSDELTYEGRPYIDKMTWDRTEMLYWLQEERKENSTNGALHILAIN